MFRTLFRWLSGADRSDDYDDETFHDAVSEFLAEQLGPEHDVVMHAIVPFSVGGSLDLFYYPHGIAGTAIVTRELVDCRGCGPRNSVYRCYELVSFTRLAIDLDSATDPSTPFGQKHADMDAILNRIARFCVDAKLDPQNTLEFPDETEQVGGKSLIFDAFTNPGQPGPKGLGVLLIIEIFRSEMEYARQHGGARLLKLLKEHGVYPYSDLDRKPLA